MAQTGTSDHELFGAGLKERRQRAGLSLRQLAPLVNYSPGWLSKVENGQAVPTHMLARSCDEALSAEGELLALAQALHPDGGVRSRPAQLPVATPGFVGREPALAQLDALWAGARRARTPLTVVLDGPPGAGKTTLAIQWASRRADHFTDGILFADLQGYGPTSAPVETSRVLERFLTALDVPAGSLPPDLDGRAALLRTLTASRHVLVILDNAVNSRQVRHLLLAAAGCAVVVTSRRRLTGLAVTAGTHRLPVGPMPADEALSLLRAAVGSRRVDAELPAARELVERCACLPLALRIAVERLAGQPHRSVAGMVAELTDDDRLDLLADEDDKYLAVRSVFSWSYRDLDAEAARAFRLLGLFPGLKIGTPAAAALIGQDLGRTRLLLERLAAVHLLEETGEDRYGFHELLRVYAAECAAAEEPEAERLAAVRRVTDWYVAALGAAHRWLTPEKPATPQFAPSVSVGPPGFGSLLEVRSWCEAESEVFVPLTCQADGSALPAVWRVVVRLWDSLLKRTFWAALPERSEGAPDPPPRAAAEDDERSQAADSQGAYRPLRQYEAGEREVMRPISLRRRPAGRAGFPASRL